MVKFDINKFIIVVLAGLLIASYFFQDGKIQTANKEIKRLEKINTEASKRDSIRELEYLALEGVVDSIMAQRDTIYQQITLTNERTTKKVERIRAASSGELVEFFSNRYGVHDSTNTNP